ncbi:unnamed protein product [Mytilus edulis]|uniref:Uncharacterized protein n=1 Tax=Mytilus edulis TaxID=6550 RepID=A0A8S3SPC7_MYTED|nr:unnamed protein product [Mytilus edulis]
MRNELKRKAEEQIEKEDGIKRRKEEREAKRLKKVENDKTKRLKSANRKKKLSKTNQSKVIDVPETVNPNTTTIMADVHAVLILESDQNDVEVMAENQTEIESEELNIELCRPRPRSRRNNRGQKISEEDDDDEVFTCGVCATRGKKLDEKNGIFWVGCDRDTCPLIWYHYNCLQRQDQITVDLSLLFPENNGCALFVLTPIILKSEHVIIPPFLVKERCIWTIHDNLFHSLYSKTKVQTFFRL